MQQLGHSAASAGSSLSGLVSAHGVMPMLGKADSLNAAVATAVMAYEMITQWRRGPKRRLA